MSILTPLKNFSDVIVLPFDLSGNQVFEDAACWGRQLCEEGPKFRWKFLLALGQGFSCHVVVFSVVMFSTCHGGSCFSLIMVVQAVDMSWWFMMFLTRHASSCLLHVMVVHGFLHFMVLFYMSWWFMFLTYHASLFSYMSCLFFLYVNMNSCKETSYFHVFHSTQGRS